MTPDPNSDSIANELLQHRIEGAMTAMWRANNEAVAGGTVPKIKLLLANFGSGATSWRQAVNAIEQASTSEHIVAVAGIGQSLETTRDAVAALSAANITTVGSVLTSEGMNTDRDGHHIQNFFRVAPVNGDEAKVALSFVANRGYQKVLLIQDSNPQDSYAQTLSSAFTSSYAALHHAPIGYTEPYRSTAVPLNDATRDQDMTKQFASMHSDICADHPDLIYFAGRGLDLKSFLAAMSEGGACSLGPVDVMTGDDGTNLAGMRMPPYSDLHIRVFMTSLAFGGEWNAFPLASDNARNYQQFAQAFTTNGFLTTGLGDGDAMMSHDAVLAAATAARLDTLAMTNPSTVGAYFLRLRCTKSIPGSSGEIAFGANGNPIDKAMPILQLHPDGSLSQEDLVWPTGKPLDPDTTCH